MVPGHSRVPELCSSSAPILPSPAEKVGLQLDAVGVFTSLGLNERLFAVSVEELSSLVSWGGGRHGMGGAGGESSCCGSGAGLGVALLRGAQLLALLLVLQLQGGL